MAILLVTGTLVGCGTYTLLPGQTDTAPPGFASKAQLRAAYDHIVPGETRVSDLTGIGFNSAAPNVETLSYLGIMERFMPHDSARFDHLSPAVQACFLASDRCAALVFHINAESPAEVTLLVQDGRIAFKLLAASPQG